MNRAIGTKKCINRDKKVSAESMRESHTAYRCMAFFSLKQLIPRLYSKELKNIGERKEICLTFAVR